MCTGEDLDGIVLVTARGDGPRPLLAGPPAVELYLDVLLCELHARRHAIDDASHAWHLDRPVRHARMLPRRSWPVAGEPPTIHPQSWVNHPLYTHFYGVIHQLQYGPAPTRQRVGAAHQQQGRRNARHKQERNKSAGAAEVGGGLAGRGRDAHRRSGSRRTS
jgi:hypothetical protein